jgi:hypothetical protein
MRYAQKLQEITASVDPTMRLEEVSSVAEQWEQDTRAFWMMAVGIVAVTASVLLLSAAGIYAKSFTVARRWRAIGYEVFDAQTPGLATRVTALEQMGCGGADIARHHKDLQEDEGRDVPAAGSCQPDNGSLGANRTSWHG